MVVFQIILAFLGLGVVAILAIFGILTLGKGLLKGLIQFFYDLRPIDKNKKKRKEDDK